MFSCQAASSFFRQPFRNISSKSVQTQISVSLGSNFNDSFLAVSNLQGVIILVETLTPLSFRRETVLSVDPVSRTNMPSASFTDSYHLSTNFSSFLHIAYTHIFFIIIPSFSKLYKLIS